MMDTPLRILTTPQRAAGLFVVCLCLIAAGCGGDDTSSDGTDSASTSASSSAADSPEKSKDEAAPAVDSSATLTVDKSDPVAEPGAVGTFAGRVVFDGTAPELELLVKAGDPAIKDKEVCGQHDVPDESLVIGNDNGVANVAVFLRKAPAGYKSEPPKEPVVLDQKGCRFFPHMVAVQVGQTLQVLSDDDTQHNVHTFPKKNQGVNVVMEPKDRNGLSIVYAKAEAEPVRVACDIHAWMASYQVVTDHPFVAITDQDGRFSIEGLPAGELEFRVWHEKAGFLERKLTVSVPADGTVERELKFGADKFAVTPPSPRTFVVGR